MWSLAFPLGNPTFGHLPRRRSLSQFLKFREACFMSATILQFRKPSTPQVNPIMVGIAQYFIGLAIVGLVMIAMIDGFMGERR